MWQDFERTRPIADADPPSDVTPPERTAAHEEIAVAEHWPTLVQQTRSSLRVAGLTPGEPAEVGLPPEAPTANCRFA